MSENKGYKFRFEFMQTEHYEDNLGQGTKKGTNNYRVITYGDTAKEAIEAHESLFDEWDKFLERKAKGPYRDKQELK